MSKSLRLVLLAALLVMLVPRQAHAYIGPGAGFALAGSFLAVFAAVLSAILTILTWPIRLVSRTLFGMRALARSRVKRVVILGLDGMDHGLTRTMLEEGKLPNFAAAPGPGVLRAARFHRAADLAGGLVDVSDRGQSRQAQHF